MSTKQTTQTATMQVQASRPISFDTALALSLDFFVADQATAKTDEHVRMIPFLVGKPGIGKSALARRFVRRIQARAPKGQQWELYRLPLSQSDPTDFGTPYFDDAGGLKVVTKCPPRRLPIKGLPDSADGKSVVIFMDEFRQASPIMQNIGSNLLDGCIGDWELDPERTFIILASNRAEDLAGVFESPRNVTNRLCELQIEMDLEEWQEWATNAAVHPWVMGFVQSNRQYFSQDPPRNSQGFATPRTWALVSNWLHNTSSTPDKEDVYLPVLTGYLGPVVGNLMYQHLRDSYDSRAAEKVMAGDYEGLPDTGDQVVGIISECMYAVNQIASKAVVAAAGESTWVTQQPKIAAVLLANKDVLENVFTWIAHHVKDRLYMTYAMSLRGQDFHHRCMSVFHLHKEIFPAFAKMTETQIEILRVN